MPFSRHTSLIRNSIYAIRYLFYNCKDNQSNVKCIVVCKNKYLVSIFLLKYLERINICCIFVVWKQT